MAYYPASTTVAHYHDANGDLLNGGTLKAFLADGTTPTPFYLDSAGTSLGTSVPLNARGEPEYNGDTVILFLNSTVNYVFALYDAANNLVWTTPIVDASLLASPLIIKNTDYAEIELLNDDTDGVSLGYRNSTGLLEIAQVVAGTVGDVAVTIDPSPSDVVELSSADPIDVRSEQSVDLTAATTITLTAAGNLTLSGATDVILGAAGAMTLTATGLLKLGAAIGSAVQIAGFTLPTADGAAGATLKTNGAGVLEFSGAPSSASSITAYARWDTSGSLTSAFNVSSVSHDSTGQWTVTFTDPLDNANYVVAPTAESSIFAAVIVNPTNYNTGTITLLAKNDGGTYVNPQFISIIVVGGRA